jgi:S1-C subfamily serine protease
MAEKPDAAGSVVVLVLTGVDVAEFSSAVEASGAATTGAVGKLVAVTEVRASGVRFVKIDSPIGERLSAVVTVGVVSGTTLSVSLGAASVEGDVSEKFFTGAAGFCAEGSGRFED